jgi:hypothetical protein
VVASFLQTKSVYVTQIKLGSNVRLRHAADLVLFAVAVA